MHHRTIRLSQIIAKNAFFMLSMAAAVGGYVYLLNTVENFWGSVVLLAMPTIAAFGAVTWFISKNELAEEERKQERTLMELTREWKEPDYYPTAKQSVQAPIVNVFKDDL